MPKHNTPVPKLDIKPELLDGRIRVRSCNEREMEGKGNGVRANIMR